MRRLLVVGLLAALGCTDAKPAKSPSAPTVPSQSTGPPPGSDAITVSWLDACPKAVQATAPGGEGAVEVFGEVGLVPGWQIASATFVRRPTRSETSDTQPLTFHGNRFGRVVDEAGRDGKPTQKVVPDHIPTPPGEYQVGVLLTLEAKDAAGKIHRLPYAALFQMVTVK